MNILITGATGGLGRNITEFYAKKNHIITATGRDKEKALELNKNNQNVNIILGNLNDYNFTCEIIKKQDIIIHCAAYTSHVGKWEEFESSNITATKNLANAALKNKDLKSFIHISTPAIYYTGKPKLNIKEDTELPQSDIFYIKSKRIAEQKIVYFSEKGLPATILRPRALFGRYDQVILPKIIKMIEKGFFPLFNKGNAIIDITHMRNVIEAIDCVIKTPISNYGKAYNITNDAPTTVKNLISIITEEMGINVKMLQIPTLPLKLIASLFEQFYNIGFINKKPNLTKYTIDLLSVDQTLSIERAKKDLNYHPVISIRDGIRDYIEWRKQ